MLWTGVISRKTGKRDGLLENFKLAYEMLLIRDNCAWWSYVDRFGVFHVTWLSSMNLLCVTLMSSCRQYQDVWNCLLCCTAAVLLM